jgi:predicted transcriptional regulator
MHTATVHDNLVKAVMLGLAKKDNGYYVITEDGKAFLKHAIEEMKRIIETTTV